VIGIVSLLWESNYAGLAERGISLVHQLAVAGPFRRQEMAMMLMGAAEDLARRRGAAELA
jgi:GNAT superfamily N-acetyltransferase